MGKYIVTGSRTADIIGSFQPREDLPVDFGLRPIRQQIQSTKIQQIQIRKKNKSCAVQGLLMATVASGAAPATEPQRSLHCHQP